MLTILGYFALYFLAVVLKVKRLQTYLTSLGYPCGFRLTYRIVVESAFYGMVTPARVGEFSKVFYLSRLGLSRSDSWQVVLLERLVDAAVLILLGMAGVVYFFVAIPWPAGVATGLFLGALFVLYYFLRHAQNLLRWMIQRFAGDTQSLQRSNDELYELTIKSNQAARILIPFTLAILLVTILQVWLLARGMGIGASGIYLGLAYVSATLVSLLPVSVSGLGTREAVYIGLLNRLGISSSAAVSLSLLDGIVLSFIGLFLLFLPFLLTRSSEPVR